MNGDNHREDHKGFHDDGERSGVCPESSSALSHWASQPFIARGAFLGSYFCDSIMIFTEVKNNESGEG